MSPDKGQNKSWRRQEFQATDQHEQRHTEKNIGCVPGRASIPVWLKQISPEVQSWKSFKSQTKNSKLYSRAKEVTKYIEKINNMMKTIFQEEFCNVYRMGERDTVQDASGKDQLRVLKKTWLGYEVIRPNCSNTILLF